jgi:hypothetical protein
MPSKKCDRIRPDLLICLGGRDDSQAGGEEQIDDHYGAAHDRPYGHAAQVPVHEHLAVGGRTFGEPDDAAMHGGDPCTHHEPHEHQQEAADTERLEGSVQVALPIPEEEDADEERAEAKKHGGRDELGHTGKPPAGTHENDPTSGQAAGDNAQSRGHVCGFTPHLSVVRLGPRPGEQMH